MELEPIYRIEYFLDAWLNSTTPPEPLYRIEYYLAKLAGADVVIPEPIYRIEYYLAYLCGEDVAIPEPIYRIEYYLAKMCGEDVEMPEPIYRVEYWYYELAGGGGDPLITLNGSLVRFTSSASKPVVEIVGQIVPIQSGSGDPSPDNVRPITGWTGANVTRTGKNLPNISAITTTHPTNWGISVDGDELTIEHKNTYSTGVPVFWLDLPVGTYTFYAGAEQARGVDIRNGTTWKALVTTTPYTFTVAEGDTWNLYFYNANATTLKFKQMQLEVGSTASSYSPYTGNTITLSFGSTVYGGNYTINEDGTVTLTVDRATDTIDGTQELYSNGIQAYGGLQVRYVPSQDKKLAPSTSTQADGLISDKFKTITYTTQAYELTGRSTNGYIYIDMPTDVTTTAQAKTWFSNNPTQVSYLLATPITTTLSSVTMLQTLVGENNMWTDTGDITVKAYGTEIVEPQLNSLQSLNLLLGNGYVNNHTADDVSDDEALDIILGGNER